MKAKNLKRFLTPFFDEIEIYLEDGRRAAVLYKLIEGKGKIFIVPSDYQDVDAVVVSE